MDINKKNDPDWCLGIVGIIGGVLYLVLGYDQIVPLLMNCRAATGGVVMLIVGIMSYAFWRRKMRIVKALGEVNSTVENVAKQYSSFLKELESKTVDKNGQPGQSG